MSEVSTPRVFGVPCGADFPLAVAAHLRRITEGQPPEALARVELWVNTRRMQRRVKECLAEGGALLLPRIRTVEEVGADPTLALPPAIPRLRRELELGQIVLRLLDAAPDLAPRSAAYALAESLAALMDEMQGEGVDPARLRDLDVSGLSDHWDRSLRFLSIVEPLFGPGQGMTPEGRRRRAVEALAERWAAAPPSHPVIVAGSTGSRGTTLRFMEAVARLPQGAVILPGFDPDQPENVWLRLGGDGGAPAEDHPQYRFRALMEALGIGPADVRILGAAPVPARNRLVSLALRPAPATDQWMAEGPGLADVAGATAGVTLIEAPDPRVEAVALALRLRQAVEEGRRAALISPDRTLTRRVTAALDRWGIEPDDSAGRPLALSPPGRFLLQTAALLARRGTGEAWLSLLKHPLAHSHADRSDHLRHARDFELHLRRNGPPWPDHAALAAFTRDREDRPCPEDRRSWAAWLGKGMDLCAGWDLLPLPQALARHLAFAEYLAGGPGGLWDEKAGIEARKAVDALASEAEHGGAVTPWDYLALLRTLLEGREVRDPQRPDPRVMVWGTIEARVGGADLVILAGLNDGIWPALPPPDPWMNRRMRLDSGLLLPERRVGLSAHDFQMALGTAEVVLSRALRDGEAETVPSRWLNRLATLLSGIPTAGGPEALKAMKARGAALVAQALALEAPGERMAPVPRPAPRPPVDARPKALSVTEIQTLIRDPYAIYARHVLRLRRLDPLRQSPDPRLRGTALHLVMERFVRDVWPLAGDRAGAFAALTAEVLEAEAPWPAVRAAWAARLGRIAPWFLGTEAARRATDLPVGFEVKGTRDVAGVALTGKADRIDLLPDGRAVIYDYKTGAPPSEKEQAHFDKQLLLLAALAERGAFGDTHDALKGAEVARVAHIALTASPVVAAQDLAPGEADAAWEGLERLIRLYSSRNLGYAARRAVKSERFEGDYDHLSRLGEWDGSAPPVPEDVG